jgi:hypothetical protein
MSLPLAGGARQASLRVDPQTGKHYVYLGRPFPVLRCIADIEVMKNAENWEGFTCLTEGSRLDNYKIDRSSIDRINQIFDFTSEESRTKKKTRSFCLLQLIYFFDGCLISCFEIRAASGRVIWGWKRNTAPVNDGVQRKLLNSGELSEADRWWYLVDPKTGSLYILFFAQ